MTINRLWLKKEGMKFAKPSSCMIHSEMMDGVKPETVLSGDPTAMLWCILAQITRISEILNQPRDEVFKNLREFSKLDKAMKTLSIKEKGELIKAQESELDKMAEVKAQKYKTEVGVVTGKLKECEREIEVLNNRICDVTNIKDSVISAKDKQIKLLTKEIKDLEHRMKEMEDRCLHE